MPERVPERRSASVEPMRELEQMTERMRRVIDETLDGMAWPSLSRSGSAPGRCDAGPAAPAASPTT